jgi:hypothetical protein
LFFNGTVVEHSTHQPNIDGLNPTTDKTDEKKRMFCSEANVMKQYRGKLAR